MKVTWESGDAYELYMGRWSRLVAKPFLDWLDPEPGLRWLDVGCGTGPLSDIILNHYKPAELYAVDQSESFIKSAQLRLRQGIQLRVGEATALPVEDAAVDITVSGLLLNIPPDPDRVLREMVRVTADSGSVAAYVWDYAGSMEMLNYFWDAAVELNLMAEVMHEGKRFADCNKPALRQLFSDAGLADITLTSFEITQEFPDFEQFWGPFQAGQGTAPTYLLQQPESDQAALRELLREHLPTASDGSIRLRARAWAIKGRVEKSLATPDDATTD
ncbi:class I SAM-dependent methyltransferase [Sedimenticola hydrogenitrophicus]|uniref:class I SAM-dependent methyltransferase n=1 Tax=Sedimenticola hydrogenitrophicus TaxID=2967975 RepID=UPI0021A41E7A|nr:methyltransferase domain-containing protein [Sedimenticola hydrogenitrophicus]